MKLKSIKIISIVVFAAIPSCAITAAAQTPAAGKAGWSLEKVLNTYRQKLLLTNTQSAKLRGILKGSYKQWEADKVKFKDNKQALTNAGMARMARTDQQVQSMLTQEQLKKYLAYKQQMLESRQKTN